MTTVVLTYIVQDQGPHALLLVIPLITLREKQRRVEKEHLELLSERVWRHTILLLTWGDELTDTTIEQLIERGGQELQWLLEKCGNRYHVLNNKNRGDRTQVTELLEKIEDMADSSPFVIKLMIVVSSANVMREFVLFLETQLWVNREQRRGLSLQRWGTLMQKGELSPGSRSLDVGLCVNLSAPGPHAFLLVTPLGRSSGEERRTLETVLEIFGERALGHTMVLLTHADELASRTLEESVHTGSRELQWLLEKCGNRYHALNNKDRGSTQVTELLEKIEELVAGNKGSYYSTETYQEAESQIRQRQLQILREREEERLREKHQKELQNHLRRMEEEIQAREEKIRALEEQIAELEERLREERDEGRRRELEEELRRERGERERLQREMEEESESLEKDVTVKIPSADFYSDKLRVHCHGN
ncbi:GTPase IMAP family member 4-like [Lepisosteus oculatus]|uniref:GTPase IMAP family member 4-like n=1 Tax=Lepisosteus oculatus TaxID=7918 RepID=UPI0035F50EB1